DQVVELVVSRLLRDAGLLWLVRGDLRELVRVNAPTKVKERVELLLRLIEGLQANPVALRREIAPDVGYRLIQRVNAAARGIRDIADLLNACEDSRIVWVLARDTIYLCPQFFRR